jgi:PKD repeat protein
MTCITRSVPDLVPGALARAASRALKALAFVTLLVVALPTLAASVNLAWDAVDSPAVTGYTVHYGTASQSYPFQADAGPGTTATIGGLAEGVTYYFAVTAYDAAGNRSGYSNEVFAQIANAAPVADFYASATWGPAPFAINFSNTSTGTITSHWWTFGDGTTSTAANPAKSYANPGVFTVSLTVTGPGGSNTRTRADYITVVGVAGDTTPPTPPASLTATLSGTIVDLAWTASADDVGVAVYYIERCQGAGCTNFVAIASTGGGTSYRDSDLANGSSGPVAGTTYRYRVRAEDAAGNRSGYSPIASVTIGAASDTTPPSAPTWSYASATGSGSIAVWWGEASDDVAVTEYRLERCQGAGCSGFAQIAAGGGLFYLDSGLAAGTTYSYRVRAADAAGNAGAYSPVSSATTESGGDGGDVSPPTAPSGLWAVLGSSGVVLGWTDAADDVGVREYLIERCAGAGCVDFVQFAASRDARLRRPRCVALQHALPRARRRHFGERRAVLGSRVDGALGALTP